MSQLYLAGEHLVLVCDVTAVERGRCPSMLDLPLYESSDHWRHLGWDRDGGLDVCPFHADLPGRRRSAKARQAERVAEARAVLEEFRASHQLTDAEAVVLDRTERLLRGRGEP